PRPVAAGAGGAERSAGAERKTGRSRRRSRAGGGTPSDGSTSAASRKLGPRTWQARERGGNSPSPGAAIGEAEHELSGMERNPGLRGPITSQAGDLANSLGYLRTQGDPGELARRINDTILPGLDRLDAELRHKAGETGGEARTASPDKIPQGYQESVAEYFRRLSSK